MNPTVRLCTGKISDSMLRRRYNAQEGITTSHSAGPRAVRRARRRARRRRRRRQAAGGAYEAGWRNRWSWLAGGAAAAGRGGRRSWAGTSKKIISDRAWPDHTERTMRCTTQGGRRAAATNRQRSLKRRRRVRRAGAHPVARPRPAPRAGPDTFIKMHIYAYEHILFEPGRRLFKPGRRLRMAAEAAYGGRSRAWWPKPPVHGGRSSN